jgi:hypothetical protein
MKTNFKEVLLTCCAISIAVWPFMYNAGAWETVFHIAVGLIILHYTVK